MNDATEPGQSSSDEIVAAAAPSDLTAGRDSHTALCSAPTPQSRPGKYNHMDTSVSR